MVDFRLIYGKLIAGKSVVITNAWKHWGGGKVQFEQVHQGVQCVHVVSSALIPNIVRGRIAGEKNKIGGQRRRKRKRGIDDIERRITRIVAPFSSLMRLYLAGSWPIIRATAHGMIAIGNTANGVERVPVNVSNHREIAYILSHDI